VLGLRLVHTSSSILFFRQVAVLCFVVSAQGLLRASKWRQTPSKNPLGEFLLILKRACMDYRGSIPNITANIQWRETELEHELNIRTYPHPRPCPFLHFPPPLHFIHMPSHDYTNVPLQISQPSFYIFIYYRLNY